ncbi:hypothetical protein ACIOHE_04895 [Streptomyces sp. NPDC087851]|uniref:hypothetical protein n=1 Tax=Streptomyces sp. NPDC087851 TaxID=3365810 RepID=UPI0037F67F22
MSAPQDEVVGLGRRRVTVPDLIAAMTLEEKLAQLVGPWQGVDRASGAVAPLQDAMDTVEQGFAEFAAQGLGQITRHYGTGPLDPSEGLAPSRVCSADASTRPAVCR